MGWLSLMAWYASHRCNTDDDAKQSGEVKQSNLGGVTDG